MPQNSFDTFIFNRIPLHRNPVFSSPYAHRTLETLSKNIEIWAANADSFSLNFICTRNYTTSVAQRLLSNLFDKSSAEACLHGLCRGEKRCMKLNAKNRMIMSENTTVEQRLDRIEQLLRGQKTVLNFAEACEFTGLSKTYMYKLTHQGRIPHFKPHGKNIYFNREELERWLLQNPVKTAEQKEREAVAYVVRKRRPR